MKFIKTKLNSILVKNKKGFTLVELIVVIAILVVLISLITPQVIAHIESANEAVCSANVNTLVQEYTAKAVWRYTMDDIDAKSMMMEVAKGHGMAFVPYNDNGLHSGCIEGVCPSGGTYVCDFTKDLLTVTMVCDKHGSIKLDIVALYEQLSNIKFDTSGNFRYETIDDYFDERLGRKDIDSEAVGTGPEAYAPYTSLASALASELKKQGIDVTNRSWRMYKAGGQYNMFLAPGKVTLDQKDQWITCEKYDMVKNEVVKGYIKITSKTLNGNTYPRLDGGSFQTQKPKDFKG